MTTFDRFFITILEKIKHLTIFGEILKAAVILKMV
jgi:hypothetical protein